jgi:hypothetical protein
MADVLETEWAELWATMAGLDLPEQARSCLRTVFYAGAEATTRRMLEGPETVKAVLTEVQAFRRQAKAKQGGCGWS